jgi:tRNA pseudouridine38-40 synthase
MNCYKLIVAYDGTDFHGWQIQPGLPTVIEALHDSFKRVFNHDIRIAGASRTDTGVHALGQVVRCYVPFNIDAETLKFAWNNALPYAIIIRSLVLVDNEFQLYENVQDKTYYYHFTVQRPLPFVQRYVYHYKNNLDIDALRELLSVFVGTHDFRGFSTEDPVPENSICSIYALHLDYIARFNMYRISITGDRFLRHMVRRIVGALLVAATPHSLVDKNTLKEVLLTQNKHHSLLNAPAQGLLLYKIRYTQ